MPTGDAFNRREVESNSVTPDSRFVVSVISGFVPAEAATAADAAQLLLTSVISGKSRVVVYDRETGQISYFEEDRSEM